MQFNQLGKWLAIGLLILPSVLLLGQTEVPEAVQATFDNLFPNVEYVEWDDDGEEFFAYFMYEERETEATILGEGTWVQTMVHLQLEDLPSAAQEYLEEHFPNYTYFDSLVKVATPSHIRYRVSLESDEESIYLTFSESGELLPNG